MDKAELIKLTLEQLLEQFKEFPDSFEYAEGSFPPTKTVLWEPRVETSDGKIIEDPNNMKSVLVTYNSATAEMACFIFNRANLTSVGKGISKYESSKAEACIISSRRFEVWRGNFKRLTKLGSLIRRREKMKENKEFLNKLYSVFPGSIDKHLFGK